MKKLIKSSVVSATSFNSQLTEYITYNRGRNKFGIHATPLDESNPNSFKAVISVIKPYDLAEYTWARIGSKGAMYVEFIRNGKVKDGMQMHYYDEEDYESIEEYIDDVIDQVCMELVDQNKDVEPRIDHT